MTTNESGERSQTRESIKTPGGIAGCRNRETGELARNHPAASQKRARAGFSEREIKSFLESMSPKKRLLGLQRIQLPGHEALHALVVKIAVERKERESALLAKKRLRYFKDEAKDLLLKYLDHEKVDYRVRAIQLLGFVRSSSTTAALLARGPPTTDVELGATLMTLGMLQDPSSIPFVVRYLDHEDPKIRVQAVTAMGGFYDQPLPAELTGKLEDPSAKVRLSAIFAIERYQDPSVAPALKVLLKDKSARIREDAKRVLEKCAQWEQEAPLMELRKKEQRAILSIAPDVDEIVERMKDGSVDTEPTSEPIPFDEYRERLKRHTTQFRVEFERYFRKFGEPISSFDTECFYGQPILYMGLTMRSPTDIEPFGAVVPSLYGIKIAARKVQAALLEKLRNINTIVTAHGFNNVERRMMYKSRVDFYDTNSIVKLMKRTRNENFQQMMYTGLGRFEKAVHFKRLACHFWKHKISEDALLGQMTTSILEGLGEKNYRKCLICEKAQDHFLYCLEDAFVSLLIYVYVKNRFNIQPRRKNAPRRGRGGVSNRPRRTHKNQGKKSGRPVARDQGKKSSSERQNQSRKKSRLN
ncbi:MAG: HEAT repeat domain-containing protein [Promethearchaeota archaeon]